MRFGFLAFVLTPLVELYLLIKVGGYIGAWPTIALVLISAIIGVVLLRRQGIATLTRGLTRLEAGELPAAELLDGFLIAVAAALLLTPGFVTDAFGFALLVPGLRRRLAAWIWARLGVRQARQAGAGAVRPGRIIEGEFERRS
jgi:UPF0716 protein FxsA